MGERGHEKSSADAAEVVKLVKLMVLSTAFFSSFFLLITIFPPIQSTLEVILDSNLRRLLPLKPEQVRNKLYM